MPKITFEATISHPAGVETIMLVAEGVGRRDVFLSARQQCAARHADPKTLTAYSIHNSRQDWIQVFAEPEDPRILFLDDGWVPEMPYLTATPNWEMLDRRDA